MTDFCFNRFSLDGPQEVVRAFLEILCTPTGGAYDGPMARVVPEPAGLRDQDRYEWRKQHWGTKWDLEEKSIRELDPDDPSESTTWDGDTPWGPPTAWAKAATTRFPGLTIRIAWITGHNDLCGWKVITSGQVLSSSANASSPGMSYAEQCALAGLPEDTNADPILAALLDEADVVV